MRKRKYTYDDIQVGDIIRVVRVGTVQSVTGTVQGFVAMANGSSQPEVSAFGCDIIVYADDFVELLDRPKADQ